MINQLLHGPGDGAFIKVGEWVNAIYIPGQLVQSYYTAEIINMACRNPDQFRFCQMYCRVSPSQFLFVGWYKPSGVADERAER